MSTKIMRGNIVGDTRAEFSNKIYNRNKANE